MKNIKLIKIAGIIAIIVLVIYLFVSDNETLTTGVPGFNTSPFTSSTQPNTTIETPTNQGIQLESGAKAPVKTVEEQTADIQFSNLRHLVPINTPNFDISKFSFSTYKFTVTFKGSYTREQFEQWLIDNSFEKIDRKYFQFTN